MKATFAFPEPTLETAIIYVDGVELDRVPSDGLEYEINDDSFIDGSITVAYTNGTTTTDEIAVTTFEQKLIKAINDKTSVDNISVEDVLNFDYNKVDKFQEQGYNSMNTAIKFFTSVFWGINEKQMSSHRFDKNSAMINKFMMNINNNKVENQLDFCKVY